MRAGAREAELSGSCSAVTRPALSRQPGTTAKNSESGSDKTEDAIFSKLNAANIEQTGQGRNSSRPISSKRDKIEIHRDQYRANGTRSKFIATNFEQTPQDQNSLRLNRMSRGLNGFTGSIRWICSDDLCVKVGS